MNAAPLDADAVVSSRNPDEPEIQTGFVAIAPGWFGKSRRFHTLVSWLSGLLALVAVILIVTHFSSLQQMALLMHSAQPWWLIGALFAQSFSYLSAALVWRQALACAGNPIPLRTLVPMGIAKIFVDQVLPSGGISGTMLVVHGLIRRAVPAEFAMAAMLVGLVSYDIAYLIVVLVSAGLLEFHRHINLPLGFGISLFVVAAIAVPGAVFGLKRWENFLIARNLFARISKYLDITALLRQLSNAPTSLLRNPTLLLQTVALQGGIFLLDALTLWLVFLAIGQGQPLWVVFASFAIASMVATIGPIPVGLGTFEATSVSMLHLLSVPIETALAGTLLLRGMTFWLPMLPGVWLAHRELTRPPKPR
ncbi:MAG: lysylphosphatidylglycerol synthase transmembrane domain-containing protein [Bordetella sp.]|uniref:lysylphosphatidylglycerol synthase transmembrane domain-containing protein n=1 Tax=Bordetella sp. TaxID=28081 RepID=UPI003F7CA081